MQRYGLDISAWQGNFNFEQAKAEEVEFIILKCGGSDSGRYKDKCFEQNYAKCKALGIPVGVYYFGADMDVTNAIDSSCHFANIICGKTFELGLFYDVEAKMLNLDKTTLTNTVKTFIDNMRGFSDKVGMYASLDTFKNKVNLSALGNIVNWVACWGNNKPTSVRADIWQYSSSNTVSGQRVDTNYCYLDIDSAPMEVAKPTLYKGCVSDEVVNLQKNLNRVLGSNLVADGIFGDKTQSALIDYQRKTFCTGIYDELTYNKLKEVIE